jgi:hypothetical protein
VSTCSKGEINNKTHCLRCDRNCGSCAGRPEICTGCGGLDGCERGLLTLQSRCVCECDQGEFTGNGMTCVRCNSICRTCDTNARKCTSCDAKSPYPYFLKDTWSCVGVCPNTHYLVNFACIHCAE